MTSAASPPSTRCSDFDGMPEAERWRDAVLRWPIAAAAGLASASPLWGLIWDREHLFGPARSDIETPLSAPGFRRETR
jgi:hypothetical protein